MVGSLISLSRVPLAPAGAEPEPSISLRGDDGTAPGVVRVGRSCQTLLR